MFDMYPYIMAFYSLYSCILHAIAYVSLHCAICLPSYRKAGHFHSIELRQQTEIDDRDEIGFE